LKLKAETRTEYRKRGAGNINRDVVVFAFFLFLAFVFWYLNSLGKESEAGIKLPVIYTGIPKERVISNEPQVWLNLYLKGTGSSIMKLKFKRNKSPVTIDISKVNYKRVPGGRGSDYYIVSSGLTKSLGIQLRSGCEITSIKPDTLFFTLERSSVKSGNTGNNDR
jgi:hypothetical protein